MEVRPRIIYDYRTTSGISPFNEWLLSLKDRKARASIRVHINRLRLGNFGDCRHLSEGVYELRIHYGPGYRIYFGELDRENIVLLYGGTKSTQKQDIKKAREYWQELKGRIYE